MRSVVPMAPSKMRMRARVSSHIFLMSSPLRPMMLPTVSTGTMSRNTLSPGHPGHRGAAAAEATVVGGAASEAGGVAAGEEGASGAALPLSAESAAAAMAAEKGGREKGMR